MGCGLRPLVMGAWVAAVFGLRFDSEKRTRPRRYPDGPLCLPSRTACRDALLRPSSQLRCRHPQGERRELPSPQSRLGHGRRSRRLRLAWCACDRQRIKRPLHVKSNYRGNIDETLPRGKVGHAAKKLHRRTRSREVPFHLVRYEQSRIGVRFSCDTKRAWQSGRHTLTHDGAVQLRAKLASFISQVGVDTSLPVCSPSDISEEVINTGSHRVPPSLGGQWEKPDARTRNHWHIFDTGLVLPHSLCLGSAFSGLMQV